MFPIRMNVYGVHRRIIIDAIEMYTNFFCSSAISILSVLIMKMS